MAEHLKCSKCGRVRDEREFFKMKTGQRCDMCKDCLTMYIDNRKPETFLWILEMFDVPFIENEWVRRTNEIYKKKGTLTPKSVIGTYLRTMNMAQYRDYHFSDSDKLNFAGAKARQEQDAAAIQSNNERERELQEKLERGEITEAQYNTLSSLTDSSLPSPEFIMPNTPVIELPDVTQQLTEDDYRYLIMKWGTVYRPEQWITMETMYNKYANEYELNIDREEVLKKMCKTSLKMDECLDAGDVSSYKNLAGVFDQLRKSGKFTEAQNKEEKTTYLDTIGELVRLAEKAGGPISNNLPDPDEYPQDKIDVTIKDLKAYNYSLIAGEPHMQDMIETFIEKYEKAAEQDEKFEKELVISDDQFHKDDLTDKEASDFQRFLEAEIDADVEALFAEVGEPNES